MSSPNKNKFFASLVIIAGLVLPILLPAFIMMAQVKYMPNEITHSGIMSLFILSFVLFIIASIFTKILSLIGLTEQKIDELGFLAQHQNLFLLKKNTKKHLYPLELRVRPNNTARYTDALSFYQGFMGFTRTKNYRNH